MQSKIIKMKRILFWLIAIGTSTNLVFAQDTKPPANPSAVVQPSSTPVVKKTKPRNENAASPAVRATPATPASSSGSKNPGTPAVRATSATPAVPATKADKTAKVKAVTPETKAKGPVLKKDGTPDKRYNASKTFKKDGTPDKRFKENKDKPAVPAEKK